MDLSLTDDQIRAVIATARRRRGESGSSPAA